jgi:hypothetical protein
MLGRILLIIALLSTAMLATLAQGHPDFSGTWKLNLDKSDNQPPDSEANYR